MSHIPRTTAFGLLLGGLLAGAPPVAAQDVILDEGRFVLYLDDTRAGTETFRLRRVGDGSEARIWADAVVELEGRSGPLRMRPVLKTRLDLAPLQYENVVQADGETRVGLEATDGLYLARIESPTGERERELRARPGTVVLEEHVVHQYYFLPSPPDPGEAMDVPVVLPRSGTQITARYSTVGPEEVRVDGRSVTATHVRLVVGEETREVWLDEQGRVLRLLIPSRSFRAERTER